MTEISMQTELFKVSEARKAAQLQSQFVAELLSQLEATEIYKQVEMNRDELKRLKESVAQLESEYKTECVEAFQLTGEKQQLGGQIKEYTVLAYDEPTAIQWAIEHNHANLLKLDKTKFKKAAEALLPEFVEKSIEPRMTLASDLTKHLEVNDE